jgi:hypothetical protein
MPRALVGACEHVFEFPYASVAERFRAGVTPRVRLDPGGRLFLLSAGATSTQLGGPATAQVEGLELKRLSPDCEDA